MASKFFQKPFLAILFSTMIVYWVLYKISIAQNPMKPYVESITVKTYSENTLLKALENDCHFLESVRDSDFVQLNSSETLTFPAYKQRKADVFVKQKGQSFEKDNTFPPKLVEVGIADCIQSL